MASISDSHRTGRSRSARADPDPRALLLPTTKRSPAQWPHVREPEREWELALELGRGRQGPRGEDGRRADGDAARPRCRDARPGSPSPDRAADHQLHRDLHLRPPAAVPAQPLRGFHRRVVRPTTSSRASRGPRSRPRSSSVAADEPGVNERIEKVHRAAARASLQTGRADHGPLAPGTRAPVPRQVEILLEEGVAPEKIQIAHTGDTYDLDYIERRLSGVDIGMDRYGIDLFLPTARSATRPCSNCCAAGHAERMFLSPGLHVPIASRARLVSAGGGRAAPGGRGRNRLEHDFLFEAVIPTLKEGGMTDEQLETMLVENPKRWLTP